MSELSVPPDRVGAAEIDVTGLGDEPNGLADVTGLSNAIRMAHQRRVITYLTEHGRRVAAITPVDAP